MADINSDPDHPVIATRSFGTEPQAVARHVRAWVEGLQAGGVAACAKHFPGHGDTAIDSHRAMPVIDRSRAELTDRELVPFEAAIGADVAAVMTSHILLPQLDPAGPATMSAPILTGLLRAEMAYPGLIITDALDMAGAGGAGEMAPAAVGALRAGADLLCLGTDNTAAQIEEVVAAVLTALEDGTLPESRRPRRLGPVPPGAGRRLGRAHRGTGPRDTSAARPAPRRGGAGQPSPAHRPPGHRGPARAPPGHSRSGHGLAQARSGARGPGHLRGRARGQRGTARDSGPPAAGDEDLTRHRGPHGRARGGAGPRHRAGNAQASATLVTTWG